MVALLKRLGRVAAMVGHPFARLYDLVHNGQDDIQAVYPDRHQLDAEGLMTHGSVNLMAYGSMTLH